ncbi:hypothetical protein BDY17DRAFT_44884 [Neohortaea acidophila]|uniref:Uncharacterized protein n=1 Tax=Neohortaea acidophila TaxID=245834 RepID=A0A6A6PIJ0_9PEZI|nr:uncharacterized protein BDY17DRAFT_44884 [Neohortaea acidophila]KAF2479735.1 hypothetical protein BDY17DRAFT_44884 [Neohortaea acidophila]
MLFIATSSLLPPRDTHHIQHSTTRLKQSPSPAKREAGGVGEAKAPRISVKLFTQPNSSPRSCLALAPWLLGQPKLIFPTTRTTTRTRPSRPAIYSPRSSLRNNEAVPMTKPRQRSSLHVHGKFISCRDGEPIKLASKEQHRLPFLPPSRS